MKNHISILLSLCATLMMLACHTEKKSFDASGSFEAEETIISAEATGTLLKFDVTEGKDLDSGQVVGYIDSIQLYLKKKQLEAQVHALLGKKPNISVQLSTLQSQLETAEKEKVRYTNLVDAGAAPSKQLDDIKAQIKSLKSQIDALKSSLDISSQGFSSDAAPFEIQIEQTQDQLAKCTIRNPMHGTVLIKYANVNEMAAIGKPLYKIADLSTINLRAFITGDQLPTVKLDQQVKVLTDDGQGGFKETPGTITWISDKAEFTPKTIQTKEERANMVYAIKIAVKNDGTYKIGMYGEVKFQ
jgi:HlyD family secretion protein